MRLRPGQEWMWALPLLGNKALAMHPSLHGRKGQRPWHFETLILPTCLLDSKLLGKVGALWNCLQRLHPRSREEPEEATSFSLQRTRKPFLCVSHIIIWQVLWQKIPLTVPQHVMPGWDFCLADSNWK